MAPECQLSVISIKRREVSYLTVLNEDGSHDIVRIAYSVKSWDISLVCEKKLFIELMFFGAHKRGE